MRHWLIKFAPFRTSWRQIVRAGTFTLRGVRSPEARNHLDAMRVGDQVLFYHSQEERAIIGILEVTREAYPDPTSADPKWLTCDFAPVQPLPRTITRDELAAHPELRTMALIRQPRLAVSQMTQPHFEQILSLCRTNPSRHSPLRTPVIGSHASQGKAVNPVTSTGSMPR